MNRLSQEEVIRLLDLAIGGDKDALETLLINVQDLVFNLSLRMLGTIQDAEDATQEILMKVMTHLSTFRRESAFTTWVFRIASNHLLNYKKHFFAQAPLSFEYYGADIASGKEQDVPDLTGGVDQSLLEQELKLSCSNVMLQCLDAEARCIFILGTMFKLDSRVAGEILNLSPEAYRQKLSRIRRKMADFLNEYCGLSGGTCSCRRRINYAIATHRLTPSALDYHALKEKEVLLDEYVSTMEKIDDLSILFSTLPIYQSTGKAKEFLNDFQKSDHLTLILNA